MNNLNIMLRTVKFNLLNKSSTLKYISTTNLTRVGRTLITETPQTAGVASSAQPIPPPNLDGQPKAYSPKIQQLVDQIANLNLIEVSDLNELLRKKLNIKDVAMNFGSFAAAPTSAAPAAQVEEAEPEVVAPKATKTSFRLKLVKYDESKKVALIKEIKALGENVNLVQAKKFIESLPQIFKDNIGKEDAEKIKAQLEKVGATCELE